MRNKKSKWKRNTKLNKNQNGLGNFYIFKFYKFRCILLAHS